MGLVFQQKLLDEQPMATRLLESAVEKNRLANAYLLVGDNISAKFDLATQVASYLNCLSVHKDSGGSCLTMDRSGNDRCQNCSWIEDRKHPQAWLELAKLVSSESTSSKIPVEAARKLSVEFTKTSSYKRVAVVENAEQDVFHRPSANALLKTIEEQKGEGVFFLFARSQEMVLTTIVSRCQVVPVVLPGELMVGPISSKAINKSSYLERFLKEIDSETRPAFEELQALAFFDWTRILSREGLGKAKKHKVGPGQVIEMTRQLSNMNSQLDDHELVLFSAYLMELEIIGSKTIESKIIADYLRQLLILTEEAKSRIARYVGKKAVFESFVFKWSQLRTNLSG